VHLVAGSLRLPTSRLDVTGVSEESANDRALPRIGVSVKWKASKDVAASFGALCVEMRWTGWGTCAVLECVITVDSMPEESFRDFVRSIRARLQDKGPVGTFLLSELDAAISHGVEERNSTQRDRRVSTPAEVIGRRTASDEELLAIVIGTLGTYLLTLPAVADSLTNYLHEQHRLQQIEITLDPSLLGDEGQQTGRIPMDAAIPRLQSEQALAALRELQAFLPEIIEEGE